MKRFQLLALLLVFSSAAAYADQAACDKIDATNHKPGNAKVQMKTSGYDFAGDTPIIHVSCTRTCSFVRNETFDGQLAAVYNEQYKAASGTTNTTIWIAKASGATLREEEDGDIVGKGKGHISARLDVAKSPMVDAKSLHWAH